MIKLVRTIFCDMRNNLFVKPFLSPFYLPGAVFKMQSVRLCAKNNSRMAEVLYLGILLKYVVHCSFDLNWTAVTATFHEDLHAFLHSEMSGRGIFRFPRLPITFFTVPKVKVKSWRRRQSCYAVHIFLILIRNLRQFK